MNSTDIKEIIEKINNRIEETVKRSTEYCEEKIKLRETLNFYENLSRENAKTNSKLILLKESFELYEKEFNK